MLTLKSYPLYLILLDDLNQFYSDKVAKSKTFWTLSTNRPNIKIVLPWLISSSMLQYSDPHESAAWNAVLRPQASGDLAEEGGGRTRTDGPWLGTTHERRIKSTAACDLISTVSWSDPRWFTGAASQPRSSTHVTTVCNCFTGASWPARLGRQSTAIRWSEALGSRGRGDVGTWRRTDDRTTTLASDSGQSWPWPWPRKLFS